jgi:hypothetical protein
MSAIILLGTISTLVAGPLGAAGALGAAALAEALGVAAGGVEGAEGAAGAEATGAAGDVAAGAAGPQAPPSAAANNVVAMSSGDPNEAMRMARTLPQLAPRKIKKISPPPRLPVQNPSQ